MLGFFPGASASPSRSDQGKCTSLKNTSHISAHRQKHISSRFARFHTHLRRHCAGLKDRRQCDRAPQLEDFCFSPYRAQCPCSMGKTYFVRTCKYNFVRTWGPPTTPSSTTHTTENALELRSPERKRSKTPLPLPRTRRDLRVNTHR